MAVHENRNRARRSSAPAVIQNYTERSRLIQSKPHFCPERYEFGPIHEDEQHVPKHENHHHWKAQSRPTFNAAPNNDFSKFHEPEAVHIRESTLLDNQRSSVGSHLSGFFNSSRILATGGGRLSRVSRVSNISRMTRISHALSLDGSIWVKHPDDIVLQFSFVDWFENGEAEGFDPPHHTWTRSKKKRLVYLVSLAATFSPLSSNIYFPALNSIAAALHTRPDLVALTITIYMIFQGLAPSFWGPLADSYGRRPVLLATLVVYLIANVALALPGNFAVLMAFRGLQAVGSSSTIAIGAGVIGDIATAGERGGFMGLFGGSR